MKIQIIIPAWPCFTKVATVTLKSSLQQAFGDRAMQTLNKDDPASVAGSINNGIEYHIYASNSNPLSRARNLPTQLYTNNNSIKQNISKLGYDSIIYIDADHGFNIGHIERLLSHDQEAVGAAYKYRGESNHYVAGDLDPYGLICSELLVGAKGLQPVDWTGGGFLRVKTKVFDKIEWPYFRMGVVYKDDTSYEVSEDIGFCQQLKKFGIPLYTDCDCLVSHVQN